MIKMGGKSKNKTKNKTKNKSKNRCRRKTRKIGGGPSGPIGPTTLFKLDKALRSIHSKQSEILTPNTRASFQPLHENPPSLHIQSSELIRIESMLKPPEILEIRDWLISITREEQLSELHKIMPGFSQMRFNGIDVTDEAVCTALVISKIALKTSDVCTILWKGSTMLRILSKTEIPIHSDFDILVIPKIEYKPYIKNIVFILITNIQLILSILRFDVVSMFINPTTGNPTTGNPTAEILHLSGNVHSELRLEISDGQIPKYYNENRGKFMSMPNSDLTSVVKLSAFKNGRWCVILDMVYSLPHYEYVQRMYVDENFVTSNGISYLHPELYLHEILFYFLKYYTEYYTSGIYQRNTIEMRFMKKTIRFILLYYIYIILKSIPIDIRKLKIDIIKFIRPIIQNYFRYRNYNYELAVPIIDLIIRIVEAELPSVLSSNI